MGRNLHNWFVRQLDVNCWSRLHRSVLLNGGTLTHRKPSRRAELPRSPAKACYTGLRLKRESRQSECMIMSRRCAERKGPSDRTRLLDDMPSIFRAINGSDTLVPSPWGLYDRASVPLHPSNSPGVIRMPAAKTILLVDDDAEIVETMRTVLEDQGFRILVARDGNSGLALAERETPDLIILDMMMPKKSGFLVLEKLKTRPGGLIPTIMITGNEGSRHRAYAEMLGVRDYIRKPFAMEKLLKSVEGVLQEKPRPRPD